MAGGRDDFSGNTIRMQIKGFLPSDVWGNWRKIIIRHTTLLFRKLHDFITDLIPGKNNRHVCLNHVLGSGFVHGDGGARQLSQFVQITCMIHMGMGSNNKANLVWVNTKIGTGLFHILRTIECAAIHSYHRITVHNEKCI